MKCLREAGADAPCWCHTAVLAPPLQWSSAPSLVDSIRRSSLKIAYQMLLAGTAQCQLLSTVERAVTGAAVAPVAAAFGIPKASRPSQLIAAARSSDCLHSAAYRPFAPAFRCPTWRALSERRRHLHCCSTNSASSVNNMAASTKPTVWVDIWSDLSCPWCWVGE